MAKHTTYTCDRCNNSTDRLHSLYGKYTSKFDYYPPKLSELCLKCYEECKAFITTKITRKHRRFFTSWF